MYTFRLGMRKLVGSRRCQSVGLACRSGGLADGSMGRRLIFSTGATGKGSSGVPGKGQPKLRFLDAEQEGP